MKRFRFSLIHTLWPAVVLLVGVILAMSITSAKALPAYPENPSNAPGGIRGRLLPPQNAAQPPVAFGWIDIQDEQGQPWMGTATDPDGRFEIPNLPPGHYVLNGYPPAGNPFAPSEPEEVQVRSGFWVTRDLNLTWPKVSGWVQDCDTAQRIPGMPVMVHTVDWTVERWGETDENGEFKIGGTDLISGHTYIAEPVPHPESAYIPVLPPLLVVPVATGVVLEVCIPPTNVIGTVVNPLGDPVPGAGVVVHQDDFWIETATEPSGDFFFRGLPPGELWLQAAPPWGPHGEGLIASPPFTIVITQTDTTLVNVGLITLPHALKTVSGEVVNIDTHTPISNAVVVAHRLDRPGFADQPVAPNGMFTLSLPGGEWHLAVEPPPPPPPPDPIPPPPGWIFLGPPAWIAFKEPFSVTEEITDVILPVISANAWVEGQVLCPGEPPGPCPNDPPPWAIWVELRNDEIGNGTELQTDYRFEIPIPDGWYELVVQVDHPMLQGPAPRPVFVGPDQRLILNKPLVLMPKDARITGQVRTALGIGVADVPVSGWQPEGIGWGWVKTDANGYYTMPVVSGEWFVEPHPGPDMPYVFQRRPQLVRVAPGGTMAGVDFNLTRAGSRIEGIAVDANKPEEGRLWGLDGWAWAALVIPPDDVQHFSDAPLQDGGFELKVTGDVTYVVGLNLSPYSEYVSGHSEPIAVDPGKTVTLAVHLERKDAEIKGQLIDALTGSPPAGPIWAEVFGRDEAANWTGIHVDPNSGRYGMDVVSGTWHLRAWVDPDSGYIAAPTETIVIAQSGSIPAQQDFPVWPIKSSISGMVKKPNGDPLPGAFVFAEGKSPFVGYYEAHTETNTAGFFELPVLDGVYVVGAGLPGFKLEMENWLNPPPIENVATSVLTPASGLELQFRQLDGLITGDVTFAGAGVTPTHPAYVWGWAENGTWAETKAGFIRGTNTFTYSMQVVSGTTWHVGAVYDDWDNGYYYESAEVVVDMTSINHVQQDLALGAPQSMPQPFIISFEGSQMQTIVMPDGVELTIPPSSIVVSGTVTLFIFPTKELRPEKEHEIIGVGYEMWAIDENGQEITQFNQNLMMTFGYPEDSVLAQNGIQEHLLVPAYYSTLAGQWILADSYVVDTANNKITLQINHFTKFGAFSTATEEFYIYLPVALRNNP